MKKLYISEHVRLFFRTMGGVLLICSIFAIFYWAYVVAQDAFSNPTYDSHGNQAIEVVVRKDDSEAEVAKQLKEKKLINGTIRFRVRKYFSEFKNETFIPGTYVFYQSQGMDDIMAILCGEQETEEKLE